MTAPTPTDTYQRKDMTMTTYKGHEIEKTSITCGDNYAHVYEIEGPHGKSAMQRPFLTSVAACKRYINERLFWASPAGDAMRAKISRDLQAEFDADLAPGEIEEGNRGPAQAL